MLQSNGTPPIASDHYSAIPNELFFRSRQIIENVRNEAQSLPTNCLQQMPKNCLRKLLTQTRKTM